MSSSSSSSPTSMLSSILRRQRWAVLGDVLNVSKPAGRIVIRLDDNGRDVYRVNPRFVASSSPSSSSSSSSPDVFTSLSTLFANHPIDVVDLCINPPEGLKQLSALPASVTKLGVLIQPGAASAEIKELCAKRQWDVVEGCVLIEMPEGGSSSKL